MYTYSTTAIICDDSAVYVFLYKCTVLQGCPVFTILHLSFSPPVQSFFGKMYFYLLLFFGNIFREDMMVYKYV